MFTNPSTLSAGQLVNANFLNANASGNINALFALTSAPSLLNPMMSGVISYSGSFDATPSWIGTPFVVGTVGLEGSTDSSAEVVTREYCVAITYTMVTNSINGSALKVQHREVGRMGKISDAVYGSTLIHQATNRTVKGRYLEVGKWITMPSTYDQIVEVQLEAVSADDPMVLYSDISICYQTRTR